MFIVAFPVHFFPWMFLFSYYAVSWKHIVLTVLIWCLVKVIFKVKIKWFYVICFFWGIPFKNSPWNKYKLVFKCFHYQFGSRCITLQSWLFTYFKLKYKLKLALILITQSLGTFVLLPFSTNNNLNILVTQVWVRGIIQSFIWEAPYQGPYIFVPFW